MSDAIIKSPFPISSLCWSRDDSLFAYTENNAAIIRNSKNYYVVNTIPVKNAGKVFLTQENSLPLLMSFYNNNVYSLWDVNSGIPELTESYGTDTIKVMDFSNNSDYVAVTGNDGVITIIFKLRYIKSTIRRELKAHKAPVYNLKFSDDSKLLASVSEDGQLCIWNCEKSTLLVSFEKIYTENKVPVCFSYDSKSFFCCDSDKSFGVYSLEGKKIRSIKTGEKIKKITSLYGREDVAAVLTVDNKIRLFNLETGKYFGYIPSYNASELTDFAFSYTNYYVLTGFSDGSIYKLKINDVVLTPDELPPEFKTIMPDEVVVKGSLHNPEIFKVLNLEINETSGDVAEQQTEMVGERSAVEEEKSEPETEFPAEEENVVENETSEPETETPSEAENEASVENDNLEAEAEPEPEPEPEKEEKPEPKFSQPEEEKPVEISEISIDALELAMEKLQKRKEKNKDTRNAFYLFAAGDYMQKPFAGGINLGMDLRILELTAPFYFGFGVEAGAGIVNKEDFPYSYEIKGMEDISPFLTAANIYLPFGFIVPLWNSAFQLTVNLRVGVRIMSISIISLGSYMMGKPYVDFFCSGEVGIMFKSLEVAAGCKYDVIGKFSPSLNIGFNFKMGQKPDKAEEIKL